MANSGWAEAVHAWLYGEEINHKYASQKHNKTSAAVSTTHTQFHFQELVTSICLSAWLHHAPCPGAISLHRRNSCLV